MKRTSSLIVCLVSPYQKPSLNYQRDHPLIVPSSQQPLHQELLFYDYSAVLSGSRVHIIQTDLNERLLGNLTEERLHVQVYDLRRNMKAFSVKMDIFLGNLSCLNDCRGHSDSSRS